MEDKHTWGRLMLPTKQPLDFHINYWIPFSEPCFTMISTPYIDLKLMSFLINPCWLFINQTSDDVLAICSTLLETAESCLGANDKYLRNTMNFVRKLKP